LAGPLVAQEVIMTVFAKAFVVLAALAFPSAAAATPTYVGGASAGYGYQEGDVLNANPGTWTSTSSITYGYAWFDESSVLLGTGPTYTLTGRDVGHQVYAAVTATDSAAPSLTVNTPTVGPIRYRPPVNTQPPSVAGVFLQGATLIADPGKWVSGGASTAPIEIAYEWYRGCSGGPKPDCSNAGEVSSDRSLTLSSADVGRPLSLSVVASYPDGAGGRAANSFWIGNLGPVITSSIKAGDTLTGTVQWTAGGPGARTVEFSVNGSPTSLPAADESGAAGLVLDTTLLPNGSNNLAVRVAWADGTTTAVPIGSVTITNTPGDTTPPVIVKPLIAQPAAVPRHPTAGSRFVVTFAVTRSDNGRPLTRGKMTCEPSVGGRSVPHAASFANGKARLVLTVPRRAKHKLLKVRLTITFGDQSTTRIATFVVR
jgi:hypothetical protein